MARTLAAVQADITATETAISSILTGGQSVEVDGQKLTRADLKYLDARLERLRREESRFTKGASAGYIIPSE